MTRPTSVPGSLARFGFTDGVRAAVLLGPPPDGLGLWDATTQRPVDHSAGAIMAALAASADPDLALRQLHRLVEAAGPADVLAALRDDPRARSGLAAVLGASAALGDALVADPTGLPALAGSQPPSDDPFAGAPVRTRTELRRAYRSALLRIAAADLAGDVDVEETMSRLSMLADETLAAALRLAEIECSGAEAGSFGAAAPAPSGLAVVAMGKCGGNELNYVSDVDVIFVVAREAELATAQPVAARLIQICGQVAWPVDANLRPEGSRGPLVRTLASHLAYYRRWARTWEFQALLKARPAVGDRALGGEWLAALQPLIWSAAERPEAVEDVRAMRRRIIANVPRAEVDREIKRGPGGLRDIEFAVQLLQLVHGRGDEALRPASTLDALRALAERGYVGRRDGDSLVEAYRFLRTVEHRLQLQRLRRTHTVPDARTSDGLTSLRWLANAMGFRSDAHQEAVDQFRAAWGRHAQEVRRLHTKLVYRPLLEAVARVPGEGLRLGPQQARARLEILGFADPTGALRHLEVLTGGVSRYAAIQRALLPVLLQEFADAPEPDRGLLAYRQVSDTLRTTPWYLRLMRDEGPVALRLAYLLGLSRYLTDLLVRDPEALRLIADDGELVARGRQSLVDGFCAAAGRYDTTASPQDVAIRAVRALRRRELFRTACADLLASTPDGSALAGVGRDGTATGQALSDITDATLAAALHTVQVRLGAGDLPFAVIGMGRLGGGELSYSSDADVLFVYEPPAGTGRPAGAGESAGGAGAGSGDEAAALAHQVAEELRRLLSAPAPEPPLVVDASLRPEGRQGPLVPSLAAYRRYYAGRARTWEAQALLRARFVCGDERLGARFLELADHMRYPAGGLNPAQITEIRRIKARVDSERLPRGADPATHVKLGRGGLADVEWAVQLLQLRYGDKIVGLRSPRTLDALAAAREAGLVSAADAEALANAWTLATRVRDALMLVRGRPSDQLPRQGAELAAVARALGRPAGTEPGQFLDEYLRTARRARAAVEHVFLD